MLGPSSICPVSFPPPGERQFSRSCLPFRSSNNTVRHSPRCPTRVDYEFGKNGTAQFC